MAALSKGRMALISASMVAALSAGVIGICAAPSARKLRDEVRKTAMELAEERAMLAKKPALESEWQAKKGYFNAGLEPDAALNAWVRELLAAAQSQALTLEKLEPAGLKAEGKTLAVFMSFRGDMRTFIRFVYGLAGKDPLSRVESFSVRQEEGSKVLLFELMLGKAAG